MLEWLKRTSGTEFLMYFTLVSLISSGVGWWLVRGSSKGYSLPDKNKLNAIAFATLRGGWQTVIDVVVVGLIERNIVAIRQEPGKKTLLIHKKTVDLSPVERVVYDYLLVPKTGSQFAAKDMQVPMEQALHPIYRELEGLHLYKTAEEMVRGKTIAYFIMGCIGTLGLSKICFALLYNKPFALLLLASGLAFFLILRVMKPRDPVTPLGRRYIKEVNEHFSWLKDDISQQRNRNSSVHDYALGTAIFGVGVLAYYDLFDGYQTFAQSSKQNFADGFDFDDWGGDSGGSGSDGGSGCGGCGGCGGS